MLTSTHLTLTAPVMRYKDSLEQQVYLKEASKNGQFELVYASLDVLGSTPWKINRKVFDVVIQVWNSGERLGKLPPAVYDKPEPEIPENSTTDMKARNVYLQRQKAYNQAKANNHSERCSVNYRLEIARAVSGSISFHCLAKRLNGFVCSSLTIPSTSRITLTSVDAHTPSLHT